MTSLSSQQIKQFTELLPEVKRYLSDLEHQDLWWTTVAMVGKINNENIDPQLLDSIVETQKEFQNLRTLMIESLISRYFNQASSEITLNAQAAIDIIIRNLFERTADVGFLATDDDLIEFMADEHADAQAQSFIEHRIEEYVAKYSVYDDIVLVDTDGKVRAKLKQNNPVSQSHDALIQQALKTTEPYLEVYRHSDLFPNKTKSLIYAKRIEKGREIVGVLCMSFEFSEEMDAIFSTLNKDEQGYKLMLLDASGEVIASNCVSNPVGRKMTEPKPQAAPSSHAQGMDYCTQTHGYQGFMGLPWYGFAQANHQVAFNKGQVEFDLEIQIDRDSPIYLHDLEEMNLKVSTLLLIVILNGKITSLKRDVKAFLPILDSFQDISQNIQSIFYEFIEHIHQVLVKTILTKVEFSATLAIEIMDRNLYERANDCRWWALNSTFRKLMSQHHDQQAISKEQSKQLGDILRYINQLYTVYTNIMLYDRSGRILAVSDAEQSHLVGSALPNASATIQTCLALESTQRYAVSPFATTELYDNQHTYIYHAPIKHWQESNLNVGGIALVFDSTPEFRAMLDDTEPKYMNAAISEATFSLFTDRNGLVIASTSEHFAIGSELKLPSQVRSAANGESGAIAWQMDQRNCILGYKVSQGYREYKVKDGYKNDVIAIVITAIQ